MDPFSKLEVGDYVRSKVTQMDITEGKEYRIIEIDKNDGSVRVLGDKGDGWWLYYDEGSISGEFSIIGQDEEDEDLIANPSHYTRFKIQPQEYTIKNDLDGTAANVVKYVTRAGHKEYPGKTKEEAEIIDLEKARDWLTERIEELRSRAEQDA